MCDCFTRINEKLSPSNGRLATGFVFHRGGEAELSMLVQTEKIDTRSRKKPPHVLPTFCPFCGTKLNTGGAS